MQQDLYCAGCGVKIQTEDKHSLGYTPKSALSRDVLTCQRCFRLKHYNEIQDVDLSEKDFLDMFTSIFTNKEALIVKIVDIFDFNGSWLPEFNYYAKNHRVILVGNKVDLLPKSVNENRLKIWMKQQAKDLGIAPLDVFLISAKKGQGINELAEKIDAYRHHHDVYIVGCTNVGKSTFINQLIKEYGGDFEQLITTSYYPGTTLNLIDIPLDDGSTMYDTPGVVNKHQMAHYIDENDLKVITPRKEIKARVYQLNEEQTLFFGGLARFDFISGERTSFVCYLSNDLEIHRTKLSNADALYTKHVGELLSPPSEETLKTLPALKRHEFTLTHEETDIVFSGLGWITVHGSGIKVAAYLPEGVKVFLRPTLI